MIKKKMGNAVFVTLRRRFSREGFHKLDVSEALIEAGGTRSQVRRLFQQKGVQIWDTREEEGKIRWYKREAERYELIESGECILIGKRAIEIKAIAHPKWKRMWWWIGLRVEVLSDRLSEMREGIWEKRKKRERGRRQKPGEALVGRGDG